MVIHQCTNSVNKTDFYLEKINLNGDEFIINNITKNLSNFSQTNNNKKIIIEGKILYQLKTSKDKKRRYYSIYLKQLQNLTIKTVKSRKLNQIRVKIFMKNFDDEFEEKNTKKQLKKILQGQLIIK